MSAHRKQSEMTARYVPDTDSITYYTAEHGLQHLETRSTTHIIMYAYTRIYRMESAQQGPMNSYIPGKTVSIQPANWPKVSQDTNTLLMTGQVLVVDGSSIVPLHLPEEYWGWSDVSLTPQLAQQLEKDLEW